MSQVFKTSESTIRKVSSNNLLFCPENNNTLSFESLIELEKHLDIGDHVSVMSVSSMESEISIYQQNERINYQSHTSMFGGMQRM